MVEAIKTYGNGLVLQQEVGDHLPGAYIAALRSFPYLSAADFFRLLRRFVLET